MTLKSQKMLDYLAEATKYDSRRRFKKLPPNSKKQTRSLTLTTQYIIQPPTFTKAQIKGFWQNIPNVLLFFGSFFTQVKHF